MSQCELEANGERYTALDFDGKTTVVGTLKK
jgi:hypothetical protein